jgi:hypothetical protein
MFTFTCALCGHPDGGRGRTSKGDFEREGGKRTIFSKIGGDCAIKVRDDEELSVSEFTHPVHLAKKGWPRPAGELQHAQSSEAGASSCRCFEWSVKSPAHGCFVLDLEGSQGGTCCCTMRALVLSQ